MKLIFEHKEQKFTIENNTVTGENRLIVSMLNNAIKYFRKSPSMVNWYVDFAEKTLKNIKIIETVDLETNPDTIY